MDSKKISIGALLVTTLVFGVLAFKAPSVVTVPGQSLGNSSPVVNVPAPVVNVQVPEQKAPVVNVNVPKQSPVLGAMAGPDVFYRSSFHKGLTVGGYIATTSTAATYTTNSADFAAIPTVVLWTPNVNTTVTLNATSTFYYVPDVGDVATVYLQNASSTAGATITLAAQNASVDLQFAEATGGDLVLSGLDWAKLTFIRQSTNKVTVIFDEMTEAD
ncbi:MAG: hypothetical protein WC648_01235 [Candidatus Paceibacterota bacterium]|jgi:hypothetical protein